MTYTETLHFLYSQLPMFSRIGAAAIKKDLTNTIELCRILKHPEKKIQTIHIAGTNGKGSTSHMLAAIFQEAGYRTGLYTSPHLKDFRERIRINGQPISKEFVTAFVEKISPYLASIQPSFFEITVAMAFTYFEQEQVEIAIIETGLGGRLDSTNVIKPELSIITNIGFDHMQLLGDHLEDIAFEKAGIIKENTPILIGQFNEITKPIFDKRATELNAELIYANELFSLNDAHFENHLIKISVKDLSQLKDQVYLLDLPGIYQTENLITVLSAIQILSKKGWVFSETQITNALKRVKEITHLRGRWDILQTNPTLVIDVAHNEDGMMALTKQLAITQFKQLHIITGMVKDKDIDAVLKLMPKNATYYFTQASIARALPAKELALKANEQGLIGSVYENVNLAIEMAIQQAKPDDLIVVCGSIFLAGEVDLLII